MVAASFLLVLLLAQPGDTAPLPPAPTPAPTRSVAQDRLDLCIDKARADPAVAMIEADDWVKEASGADASFPQQCLGHVYTSLLRWEAAERAFLVAREAAEPTDHFRRAQLAAMAANAALAGERPAAALYAIELAAGDAAQTDDKGLQAIVEVDRSRALVMQGDQAQAETVLAKARALDPQSPYAWLLSATLARRLDKLDEAQGYIETAAALSPDYPETGLEAGVIAMLGGREDAARASWNSVIRVAPRSEEAATARAYLAQLEQPAEAP